MSKKKIKNKQKPQKIGYCDFCSYCLYKDDNVATCAYFGKNMSYRYIKNLGGCRAYAVRPVFFIYDKIARFIRRLFTW